MLIICCHGVLSRMYILKLLRHQGMSSQQIITVAYALILSRITHALPAWGGLLSAALIGKINAFFKRLKRFGYISTCCTVSELIVSCDHDLFTKVLVMDTAFTIYFQLLALLTISVLVAIYFSCILP